MLIINIVLASPFQDIYNLFNFNTCIDSRI